MKNSNECDINDLFLKLKSQLLVWQDSSFEQFLKIEKEEDNFLESPLEVAEGAINANVEVNAYSLLVNKPEVVMKVPVYSHYVLHVKVNGCYKIFYFSR